MARTFSSQFYHSKAWHTARGQALRRDRFTCRDCEGRAQEVHHIIELTADNIGDPNISLNIENLMSLCSKCHARRTHKDSELREGYRFDSEGQAVPD